MTDYHTDPEAEFEGTRSSLIGAAIYGYEIDECFDADIGGSDGPEVSGVELIRLELDGLTLTRDQLVEMMCESGVKSAEESVSNKLESMLIN